MKSHVIIVGKKGILQEIVDKEIFKVIVIKIIVTIIIMLKTGMPIFNATTVGELDIFQGTAEHLLNKMSIKGTVLEIAINLSKAIIALDKIITDL